MCVKLRRKWHKGPRGFPVFSHVGWKRLFGFISNFTLKMSNTGAKSKAFNSEDDSFVMSGEENM